MALILLKQELKFITSLQNKWYEHHFQNSSYKNKYIKHMCFMRILFTLCNIEIFRKRHNVDKNVVFTEFLIC